MIYILLYFATGLLISKVVVFIEVKKIGIHKDIDSLSIGILFFWPIFLMFVSVVGFFWICNFFILYGITPNKIQRKTFVEQYLLRLVSIDDIDDFVDEWHKSDSKEPLHEYLGLSFEEYKIWIQNHYILKNILEQKRMNMK